MSLLCLNPRRRRAMPAVLQLCLITVATCSILSGGASLLSAQTTFEWPSSNFDVGSYKYIQVCYAVHSRLYDSTESRTKDWKDSLHYTQTSQKDTLLPEVVAATKRCLQQFPPSRVEPVDELLAQELYLAANEDAHAKTIVQRRLQRLADSSVDVQFAHLDSMMERYYNAFPFRLQGAADLLDYGEGLINRLPMLKRIHLRARFMAVARSARERELALRMFPKVIELARSMTEEEFMGDPGQQVWLITSHTIKFLYGDRLRAQLAQSTDKFVKEPAVIFTELVGREPPIHGLVGELHNRYLERVGQASPPVHGDYWFPTKPAEVTYPRKGVVTLIVPVFEEFGRKHQKIELKSGAAYRRLKEKWPELEIVFLANTQGFFKIAEPPPPEREAIFLDSMYRHFYELPGVLSVTKTEYWRLPGYDRRRINEETENQLLGRGLPQVQVVDKEGVVAEVTVAFGANEEYIEQIIETLIKRPYKTSTQVDAR